jgi:hypothetical protein
MFYSG